jgi:membrane-associated phospholipid phosphatase
MRKFVLFFFCMLCTLFVFPLASCSQPKAANATNFKIAINKYLAKDPLCLWIPEPFPISKLDSQLKLTGIYADHDGEILKTFETLGLVRSTAATVDLGMYGT